MLKLVREDEVSSETSSSVVFDRLKWLTTKEAAFFLRTSEGAIRTRVCRGQLRAYRYGRELRFLRSDVDRLVKPSFFKKRKE